MRSGVLLTMCVMLVAGCREGSSQAAPAPPPSAPTAAATERDTELEACRARIDALSTEPELPGTPELDRARAEVMGRARGEPLVWVRAPRRAGELELGFSSVKGALGRYRADREKLRGALLSEGYVFASEPQQALALVTLLDLPALFEEPQIVLQRGERVFELTRTTGRFPTYRHADGRNAELLFGDRVARTKDELGPPLHRDLRALARKTGFDRARILRRGEKALVAELRFDQTWVKSLLASSGASLSLECFDAEREARAKIDRFREADAPRRAALARLNVAIDDQVAEAVPFDRPRDEKTAERDGQLRPEWRWAYLHGQPYFSYEELSYPVFDPKGRPLPPQMCVDFVLDSFERASGTWFAPKGGELGRKQGGLDFDAFGIKNRRAVLSFEKFAEEHPELFEHQRMKPEERIPFGERKRFFGFLLDNADRFRPGDIVAIQGKKADGLIHQHAILIEDTDPLTGFPEALADQMKRPRRRTWEGIMAEAPLRSLLFHVRPKAQVLLALLPSGA